MSELKEDAEAHYVTVVRTQVVEVIVRADDADDAVERALASASLKETDEWATTQMYVLKVLIVDGDGTFTQQQVGKL